VHTYKKALDNLKKYTDHVIINLPMDRKREYAYRLSKRAESYGIQLYACCNDYLLSERIKKESCIDRVYLAEISRAPIDTRRGATRKECARTKSVDVRAYDTCAHGCVYCNANIDKDKAGAAQQTHHPGWDALDMQVDEKESE